MRITLHTLAVLLGVLLAVAPVLAERPEDERVCGGSPDGKIKWCITLKAPNVCGGPDEGWHCDEAGQCWCGPETAREAMAMGERCKIGRHEDRVIGGCTVAGWVCRGDWCQDSEGRAWEARK